ELLRCTTQFTQLFAHGLISFHTHQACDRKRHFGQNLAISHDDKTALDFAKPIYRPSNIFIRYAHHANIMAIVAYSGSDRASHQSEPVDKADSDITVFSVALNNCNLYDITGKIGLHPVRANFKFKIKAFRNDFAGNNPDGTSFATIGLGTKIRCINPWCLNTITPDWIYGF